LDDCDLTRALKSGFIPQHFLSKSPDRFLKAYVEQYLQEEIFEESQIRKLQSFHRFMEVAGQMNGELLNFANVASDCGVSPKTVREYYQILEDSLMGFTLAPWSKVKTRKLIQTSKFYLFDVGVIRQLRGLPALSARTTEFGNLFETFIIQEIRAYLSYKYSNLKLSYWRTTSQMEVDLIVGNMKLAIEIKSTDNLRSNDFKGLRALRQEFAPEKQIIISQEKIARRTEDGVECLPWRQFLVQLWSGALGV
jgi:predicted AAA+ superfamily ATPase